MGSWNRVSLIFDSDTFKGKAEVDRGRCKRIYESSIPPFPHLWIRAPLCKNQNLAHAQKRDCVPLSFILPTKTTFSFQSLRAYLTSSSSPSSWLLKLPNDYDDDDVDDDDDDGDDDDDNYDDGDGDDDDDDDDDADDDDNDNDNHLN